MIPREFQLLNLIEGALRICVQAGDPKGVFAADALKHTEELDRLLHDRTEFETGMSVDAFPSRGALHDAGRGHLAR